MDMLLSKKGIEIKKKVEELHQQIIGSETGADSRCYFVPVENRTWARKRLDFALSLIQREEFDTQMTVDDFLEKVKNQVNSLEYKQIEAILLNTWRYFDAVHHVQ